MIFRTRYFALALILFFCFGCKVQKKTVPLTCEEGNVEASLDALKGEYLLVSYGLTASFGEPDLGFYDFRNNYVNKKYGIKYESGGCVISQYSKCYRKRIEELLIKEYGKDILNKSEKEAISGFKKTKTYIDKYKEKVESNYIFYSYKVHERAKYIGEEKVLEEFLGRSTNPYKFDWDNEYIIAYFIVEKDGRITGVKLKSSIKDKKLNNDLKTEILQLFEKMPKWKPAIYFNEKVRVKESINIVI